MSERAAPQTVETFHARIGALSEKMPQRLRQCARHLSTNADRIAVSTVAELAAEADVPPSAVIRCCKLLGFSGFSDMQRLFRAAYTDAWPSYEERLARLHARGTDTPGALLVGFSEAGRLSLEGLRGSVGARTIETAVAKLSTAGTLHLVGLRRAFPIACYFAYAFEKMSVPAVLHDGAGRRDARAAMRAGDAVLAVTFAPYSDETVELALHAEALGCAIVGLTDSDASPLETLDATRLTVSEVDFGGFRVLSASLALAASLAVAVGAARGVPPPKTGGLRDTEFF